MARVEDYRAYAKQYFMWAQEADSEELRRASLEMASYWMEAAMRTESFGDSCRGETEQSPSTSASREAIKLMRQQPRKRD
jgi:hypothetical protein